MRRLPKLPAGRFRLIPYSASAIWALWLRLLASAEARDAMRTPVIVDGRNLLDPEEARAAGFTYEGIGRAASPLAALPETEEPERQLEA